MGVVRFAIELVAIPIILVALGVLAIFLIVFFRQRKKRSRDLEQAEQLPPFVCDQPPPPDYSNNYYPMKPPVAMVQEHHRHQNDG
ncbi:hypothetical protein CP533_3147 [Ophiocordyceps camponoti-saundersi (nom. inval.)]|nr:hypothetical protein CP533_3147 [Ophiocordyceps camponoti-saundersi (nom. inval.)]